MQTNKLKEALSIAKTIAPKSSIPPILKNVALGKQIIATDLDCTVIINTDTGISTTVSVTDLDKLIKNIKTTHIELSQDEDDLKISAGTLSTRLKGLPLDEFPEPSAVPAGHVFYFDKETFVNNINNLALSASKDTSLAIVLAGVHIKLDSNGLEMVSTDGSRLGKFATKEVISADPVKVTVPAEYLLKFAKCAKFYKKETQVRVSLHDKISKLSIGDLDFIIRNLEGIYPNYNELIPQNFKEEAWVARKDLEEAIKQLAPLTNRHNSIYFILEEASITLEVKSDIGESAIELWLSRQSYKGSLKICFDYKYVLDALKTIKDDQVLIETNGTYSPAIFKGFRDNSYINLIMPQRQ